MEFTREVVIPAALSVMFDRIFSFLIDNIPRPWSVGIQDAHQRQLELLLGIIGSVVEEADERNITNQNLLDQLKKLRHAMYRGRFALEAATIGDDAGDDSVSMVTTTAGKRKFALCSLLNAAKRARLILGGGGDAATAKRIASVVEELEALPSGCLRIFLQQVEAYPRRRNKVPWPVATAQFMDQCVFGATRRRSASSPSCCGPRPVPAA